MKRQSKELVVPVESQRSVNTDECEYFYKLWRALMFTRSEQDEHADTIRAVVNNPEFDVKGVGTKAPFNGGFAFG